MALLRDGASALDAVELAVRAVEANEADHYVGVGGLPNLLGEVELDASIMDGATRGRRGRRPSRASRTRSRSPGRSATGCRSTCCWSAPGPSGSPTRSGIERGETLTDEARQMWRDGLSDEGLSKAAELQGPGEVAYRRQALERLRAMAPPAGRGGRST